MAKYTRIRLLLQTPTNLNTHTARPRGHRTCLCTPSRSIPLHRRHTRPFPLDKDRIYRLSTVSRPSLDKRVINTWAIRRPHLPTSHPPSVLLSRSIPLPIRRHILSRMHPRLNRTLQAHGGTCHLAPLARCRTRTCRDLSHHHTECLTSRKISANLKERLGRPPCFLLRRPLLDLRHHLAALLGIMVESHPLPVLSSRPKVLLCPLRLSSHSLLARRRR